MNGSLHSGDFIVSGYEWQPQVWVVIHPETISIRGPLANLLYYFTSSLNISYKLINPTEEQSGVQTKPGEWTGMMGMLHRKEADMSVTPLLMTEERLSTVAFTLPVFIGNIKILAGRPNKTEAVFSLFSAFDNTVWAMFVVYFCMVVGLMMIIRHLLDDHPQPLQEAIWLNVVKTFNQDNDTPSRVSSVRFVLIFWSLLVLILANLYGGRMISLLTLAKPPDFIKSIDDFMRFPKVNPILHRGSNEVDYFKSSKNDPQAAIWQRIMKDPERSMVHGDDLYSPESLDQIELCKRAVFQEWRVFKGALAQRIKDKGGCSFRITPPYRIIPVGVGFRKDINPALLEQVNVRILYMLQGNMIDYIYPPTGSKYTMCLKEDASKKVTPLVWRDVIGGLKVWLVGMACAVLAFCFEALVKKLKLACC